MRCNLMVMVDIAGMDGPRSIVLSFCCSGMYFEGFGIPFSGFRTHSLGFGFHL